MKNPVIIKGNRYGIVLVLDSSLPFEELLNSIEDKFEDGVKFFDSKNSLAITFEGRSLSNEEIDQILELITRCSDLDIQYVIDPSSNIKYKLEDALEPNFEYEDEITNATALSYTKDSNDGMFYKGTLRSGQTLEAEGNLVIIGDINPGATVISDKNIIVLGTLSGHAYAGAIGNEEAFVLALNMSPMQIRIGDVIARSSDQPKLFKRKKSAAQEPQIAFVENKNIYIEPVTKSVLNDINI